MSVRLGAALALIASLHGSSAFAAEDQAVVRLSLDDALARGVQASPVVRRARAERAVVAAQRVGAGVILPYNPAVSGAFGHRGDVSGSVPPSTGFEWTLRAEQTIEIGGQRGARLREAARALDVATLRERFATAETRARIRSAYIGVLILDNHLGFARRREELGRRVYESARARVQAGAAGDVELHIAEAEAGRLTHERIEAELALASSANDLKLLLGIPVSATIELTTRLTRPEITRQNLQALIDQALAQRADLQALERTASQLDAAIVRLKREIVPSPTLFFDAQQQQPGQTYLGGGIGFAIPVWQRNQGPIALARAQLAQNEVERELAGREIAVEVSNLFRAVYARAQEVELWEKEVLPAAEANVDLISQGWRAGKFDLFRVVQASREAGEARRKSLEVVGALWHAAIELQRATGMP